MRGAPAQDPICAQVRIQISQEAVLTRTAFEATLTVVNNSDTPLTNLRVDLDIRDPAGRTVNERFCISSPALTNITAGVSGSGVIPAGGGASLWFRRHT